MDIFSFEFNNPTVAFEFYDEAVAVGLFPILESDKCGYYVKVSASNIEEFEAVIDLNESMVEAYDDVRETSLYLMENCLLEAKKYGGRAPRKDAPMKGNFIHGKDGEFTGGEGVRKGGSKAPFKKNGKPMNHSKIKSSKYNKKSDKWDITWGNTWQKGHSGKSKCGRWARGYDRVSPGVWVKKREGTNVRCHDGKKQPYGGNSKKVDHPRRGMTKANKKKLADFNKKKK